MSSCPGLARRMRALTAGLVLAAAGCAQTLPASTESGVFPADSLALLVWQGTPHDALATGALCTGTLIGERVLTAAHCVREGSLEAVVGVVDMCHPGPAPRVALGAPLFPHGRGSELDVAWLPVVGPISSPAEAPDPAAPGQLVALGFGGASASGVRSCGQHRVVLEPLPADDCTPMLKAAERHEPDPRRVLCAPAGRYSTTAAGSSP